MILPRLTATWCLIAPLLLQDANAFTTPASHAVAKSITAPKTSASMSSITPFNNVTDFTVNSEGQRSTNDEAADLFITPRYLTRRTFTRFTAAALTGSLFLQGADVNVPTSTSKISKSISSKIIRDKWVPMVTDFGGAVSGVLTSSVLTQETSAEGLAIQRYKCLSNSYTGASSQPNDPVNDNGSTSSKSSMILDSDKGHIFSLLQGQAKLRLRSESKPLTITKCTHLYIPPGENAEITFSPSSYAIHVSGAREFANGSQLLIRNERFARVARDVLTPQYLSRRMFTNRDKTLQSKYGTQVAWFHTTMFDSMGLGVNDEGRSVFKMSYDHQTEPNVVYSVGGEAEVRFAQHPYVKSHQGKQVWSDWQKIDGETTYYLNEASDGTELETIVDGATGKKSTLRNRHEVSIASGKHGNKPYGNAEQGFVSLCCLFDPGPTGLEKHVPGEYSSYAPVANILDTPEYKAFVQRVAPIDEMIDVLSLETARGADDDILRKMPQWSIYEEERMRQLEKQNLLIDQLMKEGKGREKIVGAWRLQ